VKKRYLCSKYRELLIYPCQFMGGVFVTDDPTLQGYVEKSATFAQGVIDVREEPDEDTILVSAVGEGTPPQPESSETKLYLSQMNKAQLLEEAAKRGVEVAEDMTRAEIYTLLRG
jgi:hypothetical protein